MLKIILLMLMPLLISIRTISFGLYNWKQGNKLGGVGVWIIALCSVSVPLIVLMIKR